MFPGILGISLKPTTDNKNFNCDTMMKIAVLAALAGSASAFAPSSGGVLVHNFLLSVDFYLMGEMTA